MGERIRREAARLYVAFLRWGALAPVAVAGWLVLLPIGLVGAVFVATYETGVRWLMGDMDREIRGALTPLRDHIAQVERSAQGPGPTTGAVSLADGDGGRLSEVPRG